MLSPRLMEKPRIDSPLELQPLEIALSKIVKRLAEQNDKKDHQPPRETEEEKAENHRRYVEQRVRETLMWERRISQPKK